MNSLMMAKVLPEPGVPSTIVARNGFTTFSQPWCGLPRSWYSVRRFTEYSFSISRSSCGKLSLALLKMSFIRSLLNSRLSQAPALSSSRKPADSSPV